MTDIRNDVVVVVAAQWMPSINVATDGTVSLKWNLWDGNPAAWSVTTQQTSTLSIAMLRAVGAALTAAIAGGAVPATVAPSVGGDPECIVNTAVVAGRANVTMQFRDAATHVNIDARCDLDVPSGYATKCATAFTECRVYGL